MAADRADPAGRKQPRGRPFQKGSSGNPKGRPAGRRNRSTELLAQIDRAAPDVVAALVKAAVQDGDVGAAKILLDRLVPPARDRPLAPRPLPVLTSAADAAAAMAEILAAVAGGELTPGEGEVLAGLVDTYRKTLETTEIETRLRALEERTQTT